MHTVPVLAARLAAAAEKASALMTTDEQVQAAARRGTAAPRAQLERLQEALGRCSVMVDGNMTTLSRLDSTVAAAGEIGGSF